MDEKGRLWTRSCLGQAAQPGRFLAIAASGPRSLGRCRGPGAARRRADSPAVYPILSAS